MDSLEPKPHKAGRAPELLPAPLLWITGDWTELGARRCPCFCTLAVDPSHWASRWTYAKILPQGAPGASTAQACCAKPYCHHLCWLCDPGVPFPIPGSLCLMSYRMRGLREEERTFLLQGPQDLFSGLDWLGPSPRITDLGVSRTIPSLTKQTNNKPSKLRSLTNLCPHCPEHR